MNNSFNLSKFEALSDEKLLETNGGVIPLVVGVFVVVAQVGLLSGAYHISKNKKN